MRAAVADLVPIRRRGSAYGIFNTVYGGAWFLGSVTFGLLYDQGLLLPLVLLSAVLQVLSVPAVLRLRVMAAAGPPR
jgi:MFS family permease